MQQQQAKPTTTTADDLLDRVAQNTVDKLISSGDLADASHSERIAYYRGVCESLGLNAMTQPFLYLQLNGKLQLYATKSCTEQLRRKYGVSIVALDAKPHDGIYVVTASARTADGRTDFATGAVNTMNLKGDALANAIMKAETKAKRRVTLSICGLAMLDESELETVPQARTVDPDQRPGIPMPQAIDETPPQEAAPDPKPQAKKKGIRETFADKLIEGLRAAKTLEELQAAYGKMPANWMKTKDSHTARVAEVKDVRKLSFLKLAIDDKAIELKLDAAGLAQLAADLDITEPGNMNPEQAMRLLRALQATQST